MKCVILFLSIFMKLVTSYYGTIFSDLVYFSKIHESSDKYLMVNDMYTRSYENVDRLIGPQAIQIYLRPAHILGIETPYSHVISNDGFNSIIYDVDGMNTTFLGRVAVLLNSTSDIAFMKSNQVLFSTVEFLNFTEFKSYNIDWTSSSNIIIRDNLLPNRDECFIVHETKNIYANYRTIILNNNYVNITTTDSITGGLISYDANSMNWNISDKNMKLLNVSCDFANISNVGSSNIIYINNTVDEYLDTQDSLKYVIEYQTHFDSLNCSYLRVDTENIFDKPILSVLEHMLQPDVLAFSNSINATDITSTCFYKMVTVYNDKYQASLAYHHLNRLSIIHKNQTIDTTELYAVPSHTFTISANMINDADRVSTATCNYTINLDVSVP